MKFSEKECICLYFFVCFFVEEISENIAEKQAKGERDPDLKWEEEFMISNDSEEKWK